MSQKLLTKLRSASHLNKVLALAVSATVVVVGYSVLITQAADTWPATPPAEVCGDGSILDGPSTAPPGAITVPAGDNSSVNFGLSNTTYWFESGVHTLGSGQFSQIIPGDNSRFVGAPGAILDGQKINKYAFTQHATNVTIEHLTIRNFGPEGSNNNEGVVNHDAGDGWTIQYNTITGNAGAGMMVGTDNVVRYNCLTENEQYGFNAYEPDGPSNITMDHNEISYNNTYDWESEIDGCGCTGGGKFWAVDGATVTNNYVHHNHSVGLWADNNNRGFLFEGNYVSDNYDVGIFYETSYNALIRNNTLIRNALGQGPTNPGFPTGAIYISEAGSDTRVDTPYKDNLEITGNLIEDNWSGIILWENADRYCGSPANTSSGECTLVNPDVVTDSSCNATNIDDAPYYEDCRWKTQNVKVHGNTFRLTPSNIGASCTFANSCGFNGIFSNYGTYPEWSPYMGTIVQNNITYSQNNSFYDNAYEGSWQFLPFEQGNLKSFTQWQASPYSQDAGSTFAGDPDEGGSSGGGGGGGSDGGTKTFEEGTNGMTAWFSSSVAQSTDQSHGGSNSLAITATGGGWGVEENWPGEISVTGDTEYDISAWIRAGSTGRTITMSVIWLDDGSSQVGSTVTANATDNSSEWTEISTTATTPADAASAVFRFTASAGSAGEIHYLDDVSITAVDTTPPDKVGDLNGDDLVNVQDLSILLANWQRTSSTWTNAKCDINGDGTVTVTDLSILLSKWGT